MLATVVVTVTADLVAGLWACPLTSSSSSSCGGCRHGQEVVQVLDCF